MFPPVLLKVYFFLLRLITAFTFLAGYWAILGPVRPVYISLKTVNIRFSTCELGVDLWSLSPPPPNDKISKAENLQENEAQYKS